MIPRRLPRVGAAWLLLLTMTALLCAMLSVPAHAQDAQTCSTAIFNPHGLLTDEDTKTITTKLGELRQAGAQGFVAAIRSTGPASIDQALTTLLSKCPNFVNESGHPRDNVIAIMVATEDRKTRIEVGSRMGVFLRDQSSYGGELEDTMNSIFKTGDYGAGLAAGLSFITTSLNEGIDLTAQTTQKTDTVHVSWNIGPVVIPMVGIGVLLLFLTGAFSSWSQRRKLKAKRAALRQDLLAQANAGANEVARLLEAYTALELDAGYFASLLSEAEAKPMRETVSSLHADLLQQSSYWQHLRDDLAKATDDSLTALRAFEQPIDQFVQSNAALDKRLSEASGHMAEVRVRIETLPTMEDTLTQQATDLIARATVAREAGWTVDPAMRSFDMANSLGVRAQANMAEANLLAAYGMWIKAMDELTTATKWVDTLEATFAQLQQDYRDERAAYATALASITTAEPVLREMRALYAEPLWQDIADTMVDAREILQPVPGMLDAGEAALDKANVRWDEAGDTLAMLGKRIDKADALAALVMRRNTQITDLIDGLPAKFQGAHQRTQEIVGYMDSQTLEIKDDLEAEAASLAREQDGLRQRFEGHDADLIDIDRELTKVVGRLNQLYEAAVEQVTTSGRNREQNAAAWNLAKRDVNEFENFLDAYQGHVTDNKRKAFKRIVKDFNKIAEDAITMTEGTLNKVAEYEAIQERLESLARDIMERSESRGQYSRSSIDDMALGMMLGSMLNDRPYYRHSSDYYSSDTWDDGNFLGDLFSGGGGGMDFGGGGGGGMSFGGGGGSFSGGGSTSGW